MRRVAIYIRVSTEEQAREGYSISAQREKLKAYCLSQGWTVVFIYVDDGISAKNMNRKQLQLMLADIRAGKIDCVLVYRLDRLTRSVSDLYKLLEMFDKYDCKFKSATEVYDTTTAMGRMFITIVAALAQWERENMGERISMGYAEKVRQGKYAHNIRPFGYDLDLSTGILTINNEEAKIIKLIVDLYLHKGLGANRICQYLNKRGITTKDGNTWNDKPLIQILRNPVYKGSIRWAGETVDNAVGVPAIIDEKTFDEIQETLERRKGKAPRSIGNDYIFSGVCKCSGCGNSMAGSKSYYTNPQGEKIIYKNYKCYASKSGQCLKSDPNISEMKLEDAFIEYLQRVDFTSVIPEVAATRIEDFNQQEDVDQQEEFMKELEKINKRKKKWQYAWANEKLSDDDFSTRMDEEYKLETRYKEQLESLQPKEDKTTHISELISVLNSIKSNWDSLLLEEKKSFIQTFIKQIHVKYVNRKQLTITHIDFV